MFGLRFKSPYRRYEYSRFSEKDQTTCTVYESQYNPVMDITGFGVIGWMLCIISSFFFKFEYNFNIMLVFFVLFMIIRLYMITEKDEKLIVGE